MRFLLSIILLVAVVGGANAQQTIRVLECRQGYIDCYWREVPVRKETTEDIQKREDATYRYWKGVVDGLGKR